MKQQLVFEAPRRALPPRHLADLDEAERIEAVAALGLPAFRAKQLAHQYYGRLIGDPQQMTDLPAAVRGQVADALFPDLLTAARDITCDAGQTRKTLWRAIDGTTFESVLMRYPQRNTVCISSQAGCGMACPFCATGQGGLTRNLSTAEIVEQVRAAAAALRDEWGDRLSNVVFMGMGEPLANYARVLAAVRRITGSAEKSRVRHLGAVGDGVDGRPGAGHPQTRRRATRGHAGIVTARSRRRVTRHPGAGQQPVEDQRSARRGPLLRRADRSTSIGGIRADSRRQRPALARGPAGQAAAPRTGPAGARERHSAEPDTRQRLGRQPEICAAGVRSTGPRQRRALHGARHPRRARSPPRAASWPLSYLPEPAAPAAPPVTHDEEEHQHREADARTASLDVADVVAVQKASSSTTISRPVTRQLRWLILLQPQFADGTSATSTPLERSTSVLATATPRVGIGMPATFWHIRIRQARRRRGTMSG